MSKTFITKEWGEITLYPVLYDIEDVLEEATEIIGENLPYKPLGVFGWLDYDNLKLKEVEEIIEGCIERTRKIKEDEKS